MSAVISVSLNDVHPVIDGRWHRVYIERMPVPGEDITTFCGLTESVAFEGKNAQFTVPTCWDCDLVYRRRNGIPYRPDHPGLAAGKVVPAQPSPYPH